MKNRQTKFALLPLVAMLAVMGSGRAYADSAVGVDTVLGNVLLPGGGDAVRGTDPQGFSLVMGGKGPSHTPSGQLYLYPMLTPAVNATDSGWTWSGSIEAGYLGGRVDTRAAGFREYADWRNGALLTGFELSAERPDNALYVDVQGSAPGRDDQFFRVEAGRYNGVKFSAFYSQTPHVFATNARPIWNGVGTGSLTLPAGLVAGTHTQADAASYAALQAAVANAGETTLNIDRKKVGLRVDAPMGERLNGFFSYTNERREGERPFGGGFIFDFIRRSASNPVGFNVLGAVNETVEPIDYTTHEFLSGLRYVGDKDRLNLTVAASLFRNDNASLTWENPFSINFGAVNANASTWETGRFALNPDNDAYNVKVDYARMLPMQGQFTAVLSTGRMSQDERLLPPTINDGVNAFGVPASYAALINGYDTTRVLSRQRADARIDTRLADFGLSLSPLQDLTVRAKLRYYDEDNRTRYAAIDPNTGIIGYPGLDYGLPGVFGANFGFYNAARSNNIHYISIPTSYTKLTGTLGADYQLTRLSQLGATFEREETERPYREVKDTVEDRLKFAFNTRAFDRSTVRASYEYADRRGSEYRYDIYEQFYTSSRDDYTGPTPIHTLAELRKFDLADRRQQVLNLRWNYMLREDMDAMLSMQHKLSDYSASDYGRIGEERLDSLNLEWTYVPAPGSSFFTWYSVQAATQKQGNINQGVAGTRVSSHAGVDAMYPLENAWTAGMRDLNHALGLGFTYDFGWARVESRYSYMWSVSRQSYDYVTAEAATVGSGTNETQSAAMAGTEFADMRYRQQVLETSVLRPLDKHSALRFFHRWEKRNVADWHYTGLDGSPLIGQKLYLGATPEDYNVNVFGVFWQYSL
ncbi:MtrB/PioB family decaheme-associated outer membrane protein [Aromatoleum evansii]|uniref:MtrB/PioB family decaheme-associated outer membrane protein n=1 Tax=Aromatoleum evansii TaxID=59406 RepID=UPI00145CE3AE|nr:MtrB/PioB family decaheme-associated outer membrane protein [Aromatoleum evansii]NMG27580.1 MtrB/PioB family decaheme-associated outer membrane protein [Aromatoleum evansii]